jgi:hypothetical protein
MRKVIDKKKIRVRKGKKEDKMTAGTNWKGDSPRRPQFLGALERGAFKKADDLETTSGVKYTRGMETMLPRLRMAINAGRRELGKEARRYATEYVREMQIKLKGNLRRLKKARDNYENLLKSSNDSVKKALDLKRISTATALTKKGMGLDKLVGMFANLEQEISNNQKSGAITGVLAEQLREAFQEYKDARNEAGAIEQTVDGWIVKRAKIREEMERHLLGYADKMISRLMYRYHLFEGFEGSRGEIAGPSQ